VLAFTKTVASASYSAGAKDPFSASPKGGGGGPPPRLLFRTRVEPLEHSRKKNLCERTRAKTSPSFPTFPNLAFRTTVIRGKWGKTGMFCR
jgi:hypothetical protein